MAITDIVLTGYVFQDDGDALQGATVQLLETGTTTEETSYSGGTTSAGLWTFTETSLDTTYDIKITSGTSVRYRNWADEIALKGIDTSYAKIRGTEGAAAPLYFFADQADDAGDAWRIQASASDTLAIGSDKASAGTIIDYVTITNGANAAASTVTVGGILAVTTTLDVNGTADFDVTDFDIASSGDIDLVSTNDAAAAIYLRENAGTSGTIKIHADQGTSESSIQLLSDAGGVDINAATGKDVDIAGGTVNLTSSDDAASAIYLRANAGTSETIVIHADQGTGTGSIELLSDDGGIELDAGTDIILDAGGADIFLKDDNTLFGTLSNDSGELVIKSSSSGTTAMTFSGANVTFAGTVTIGSAGISETELEILDGATVTTTELNLIDGGTARGTTAIADGDGVLINDAGTMRMTTVQTLAAYLDDEITAMPNLVTTGTIGTGVWEATDVGVAHGGTGVSTLTDGGVLLGSGASAITAMAVLADSEMIVGNGSTDPVAESGATLRTSIGVGTGDSVQFAGITGTTGIFSTSVDITGSAGIILENDETITNSTNGLITLSANLGILDDNEIFFGDDSDFYIGYLSEGTARFIIGSGSGGVHGNELFSISSSVITMNNDNADIDFQVDGVGFNSVFHVNAATMGVGIGDNGQASTMLYISPTDVTGGRTAATVDGLLIAGKTGTYNTQNTSGTLAIGSLVSIPAPTLTNDNATLTYTDFASLYIAGVATDGTNVTFTNTEYALWVDSGNSRFDGTVELHSDDTSINSGDDIGLIEWNTHDGSTQGEGAIASMRAEAASNYTGARAADIVFSTSHSAGGTFTPVDRVRIGSRAGTDGGIVTISDAATSVTKNANMTTGLTINQGAADNEIFALKSSDVGHGMTAFTETDNFGYFHKDEADGGLAIKGLKDASGSNYHAVYIRGIQGEAASTTKSDSGRGVVAIDAQVKDGTGAAAVGSNGNLLSVSNSDTVRFIVDAEGDLHGPNATISTTGMDDKDDVALVRSLDHLNDEHGMKGIIREKWDNYVRYNEQDLLNAEILGDTIENKGFINITGMQRLHSGAIWQLFEDMMSVAEALPDEARKKLSPRIQNALQGVE